MAYRTYDKHGNWTGYADTAQYLGQQDIPPCKTCGEPAEREIGPWNLRRCANGHVVVG